MLFKPLHQLLCLSNLVAFYAALMLSPSAEAEIWDWISSKLPYELPRETLSYKKLTPQSSIEVLDNQGQALFYIPRSEDKIQFFRPLTRIDPLLQKFVVLSEDARFFSHDGLDLEELKKAVSKKLTSGAHLRGASTISQQIVKNLFLDKKRSYTRKLFEIPWVKKLEEDLSKEQILELYLNIIEWGPGIYGAEAAARHFFDKSAEELKVSESLYLTMIIPNPTRFDGYKSKRNIEFLTKKGNAFLSRLQKDKVLNAKDVEFIKFEKIELDIKSREERTYPFQHSAKYTGLDRNSNSWDEKTEKFLKKHLASRPQSKLKISKEEFFSKRRSDTPLTIDEVSDKSK